MAIIVYLSAFFSVSTVHAWSADYYYDDNDAPQFGDTFHSPATASANSRQHSSYHGSSSCECIKLKDCSTITFQIRTATKPLTTDFMTDIRKKSCGFVGNEPYICCPKPPPPSAFDILPRSFRDMTSERPWIWDVNDRHAATMKPTDKQSTNLFNRLSGSHPWNNFNFLRPNDFNPFHQKPYHNANEHSRKIHFFDFEDPRTFRNCPPSFSPDFNTPPHFHHVRPIQKSPHTSNHDNVPMPSIVTTHTSTHSHPHSQPHPHSTNFDSNSVDIDPVIVFPSRSNAAVDPAPTFPSRASKFPPEKLNLVNQENCGISIGARIIGGINSVPGQFPW